MAMQSAATSFLARFRRFASLQALKCPPPTATLHAYSHCQFCIRAELALGWRGVDYQLLHYRYGDTSETTGPKKLLGKKSLPVLEMNGTLTPESLAIVDLVDSLDGADNKMFAPATERFDKWRQRFLDVMRPLMRPRIIQLRHLKDFETDEDVKYSRESHKDFNYEEALANTDKYTREAHAQLQELDAMLHSSGAANASGRSLDDILILPVLRNITCVRGIDYPPKVREYIENGFNSGTVVSKPFFDYAI